MSGHKFLGNSLSASPTGPCVVPHNETGIASAAKGISCGENMQYVPIFTIPSK